MKRTTLILSGLAIAAVAACHHAQPVVTPTPAVNSDSLLALQRTRDSVAAAARLDSERIARQRAVDSAAAATHASDSAKAVLAQMIHFDFDKSNLRSQDVALLDLKIPILLANPSLRIQIAGNCDERGSTEYNLALGNRRAISAKDYLTAHGVTPDRIETISYGEERPLDPAHNEIAWAKNRRDEFTILSGGTLLVLQR
jgi:peptidoglycan-associated lipoprotein